MSEEAEKIIQTIKQGSLPSLTINNDKGTQSSSSDGICSDVCLV